MIERIREVLGDGPSYITYDIDGAPRPDPTEGPRTAAREPGGLSMRDSQVILRSMTGLNVVGGDVCEETPSLDPSGITAMQRLNSEKRDRLPHRCRHVAVTARIDQARLWQAIQDMAKVGSTPAGGVSRIALTPEDVAGRELLHTWVQTLGCEWRNDEAGNVFSSADRVCGQGQRSHSAAISTRSPTEARSMAR